ncbi:MAG: ABC transporter permease [Tenuifilaceae bacterium]|jgi:ABC-type antimicrobial peptide transport system permease subunit|nr:ABC transporter permease [Tenuifilaceae bacterium]
MKMMSSLNLKLFLRKTAKDKLFVLVNTVGLSIGIATVFLLFFWIMYEFGFDRFHKNYDNIYLVSNEFRYGNGTVNYVMETPGQLAKHMKDQYPEVQKATTCMKVFNEKNLTYGEQKILGKGYAVQPDFFEIFTFDFLEGDKNTSLSTSNSIILSERFAAKLFHGENPIGKKIKLEEEAEFVVAGLLKDIPENSSIKFDYLIPMSYIGAKYNDLNEWYAFGYSTFVLLDDKIDVISFSSKIKSMLGFVNFGKVDVSQFLFPLKEFHFNSDFGLFVENPGDIKNAYILIILALFILVISIINYVILTVARSDNRQKEIGIKQTFGVHRFQLLRQFYFESFFLTCLVSVISLLIVFIIIPKAQLITGRMLIHSYFDYRYILGIIAIVCATTILAGLYPSLYLSSLKPLVLVQNHLSRKSMMVKKGLVLFQFIIVMFVTISVASIYTQVDFMMNKNLGYNKDNLVWFDLSSCNGKADEMKSELLKNPNIKNVTQTSQFVNLTMETSGWDWKGNTQEKLSVFTLSVGSDFTETMNIDVVKGEGFSSNESNLTEVMLNEAACKFMGVGVEDCIGMVVKLKQAEYKVVGVVKDFHFSHLKFKIKPLLILYKNNLSSMIVRLNGDNKSALSFIGDVYNKFNTSTDTPFSYSFVADDIVTLYGDEKQLKNSISGFLVVLLFISIIAIIGMMASNILTKTKEIGVRKVLGAHSFSIILFLLKDIVKIVVLAYAIALPVAIFVMNKWLDNFANHIKLGVATYVLIGLFFISFAFVILLYQSYKAAKISPVKILASNG